MQESDATVPVDDFIMEATSSVAVAIRVDASQYFVDEKEICNKVIHSVMQKDSQMYARTYSAFVEDTLHVLFDFIFQESSESAL